jgi:two-component system sensor histidine kinase YesM
MKKFAVFWGTYRARIFFLSLITLVLALCVVGIIDYIIVKKSFSQNIQADADSFLEMSSDRLEYLKTRIEEKMISFSEAAQRISERADSEDDVENGGNTKSYYQLLSDLMEIETYFKSLADFDTEISEVILITPLGQASTSDTDQIKFDYDMISETNTFDRLSKQGGVMMLSHKELMAIGFTKEDIAELMFYGMIFSLNGNDAVLIFLVNLENSFLNVDNMILLSSESEIYWISDKNDPKLFQLSGTLDIQTDQPGKPDYINNNKGTYVTMERVGDEQLTLVMSLNMKEETYELYRVVRELILILIATLLFFGMLDFIISKKIVENINNLNYDVKEINMVEHLNPENYSYKGLVGSFLNRMKFRDKLLLHFLTNTVLPVIIAMILLFISTQSFLSDHIEVSTNNNIAIAGDNIDFTLKNVKDTALSVALSDEVQTLLYNDNLGIPVMDFQRNITRNLLEKAIFKKGIKYVSIYTNKGELIYSSTNLAVERVDIEKRYIQFLNHDDRDRFWIDGEVDAADELVNTYVKKIMLKPLDLNRYLEKTKTGELNYYSQIGYVEVGLSDIYIRNLLESLKYGELGKVDILNSHETQEFESDKVKLIVSSVNGNYITKYALSERSDWYIFFEMPYKEMFADRQVIIRSYFMLTSSVLLLIFFLSMIISTRMTKPLLDLERKMRAAVIGESDINETKNYGQSNEVLSLVYSFNELIGNLHRMMDEIYMAKLKEKELTDQKHQLERRKNEAELIAFQSQINPHFLYNTFASISFMMMLGETDDASDMLNAVGTLFRKGVFRGSIFVKAEEEIAHVEAYVDIQKMRYRDKLTVDWHIDRALYDHMLLKLILQPLVENSIYHGIEVKEGKGRVEIKGSLINKDIVFEIKDDGVGIDQKELSEIKTKLKDRQNSNSIGLRNVDERIKLYFGDSYGLSLESRKGVGTLVTLVIPATKIN